MLSAAGALRWFRDTLAPGEPYERLLAEAERLGPRRRGAPLPAVPDRRADAARRPGRARRLHRPSARHDRGALVRAVLEGVAYGLRDSLEILRSLGCRLEFGRVSGGGARSELWLRIVASVLGLPGRADGRRGGRRVRGRAPRRRRRRRVRRRPRGRGGLRRRPGDDRARPRVGRRLRGGLRALPLPLSGTTTLGGRMSTKWGIISTAHINRLVLAGARESDRVDVVAVASRDQARAEAYAREHGIERAHGSYEALLADAGGRGRLHLAPELAPRRVVDPRARGRQARPLREAARPPAGRGRARLRRRRPRRADPDGGVHVPPQPADGEARRAGRRRRDRRAAASSARPSASASTSPRTSAWPPTSTAGRSWTSAATASAARASSAASPSRLRRAGHRRERGGRPLRGHDALPRRRRSRSSTAASSCRTATSSRSSAPRDRSSWTTPGTPARP